MNIDTFNQSTVNDINFLIKELAPKTYGDILINFHELFKLESCVKLKEALNGGENSELFKDKKIIVSIKTKCELDISTIFESLGDREIHSLNLMEI